MQFLSKLLSLVAGHRGDRRELVAAPSRNDMAMVPRGNDDIIGGYQYSATLQLRTPLFVLKNHGRFVPATPEGPPRVSDEMWHGIWVLALTDEFKFLDEGATASSEIGYVPADGGDFLPFLIAVRTITENPATSLDEKKRALKALIKESGPRGTPYSKFMTGRALVDRALPSVIDLIPATKTVRNSLVVAGYDTLGKVQAASDQELLALKGLGTKSLKAIREFKVPSDIGLTQRRYLDPEFKSPD